MCRTSRIQLFYLLSTLSFCWSNHGFVLFTSTWLSSFPIPPLKLVKPRSLVGCEIESFLRVPRVLRQGKFIFYSAWSAKDRASNALFASRPCEVSSPPASRSGPSSETARSASKPPRIEANFISWLYNNVLSVPVNSWSNFFLVHVCAWGIPYNAEALYYALRMINSIWCLKLGFVFGLRFWIRSWECRLHSFSTSFRFFGFSVFRLWISMIFC